MLGGGTLHPAACHQVNAARLVPKEMAPVRGNGAGTITLLIILRSSAKSLIGTSLALRNRTGWMRRDRTDDGYWPDCIGGCGGAASPLEFTSARYAAGGGC
jgi:hypothetical protein